MSLEKKILTVSKVTEKQRALIVVDMQNDFMPKGSLAVKDGDEIIPGINELMNSDLFNVIVGSKDSHPRNHCSFKENGGIWPYHCVVGTYGCEFAKGLDIDKYQYIIKKGQQVNRDSYSAFFDDGQVSTELNKILKDNSIKEVYVVGVAFEYCVKATALDSAKLGYKTFVIEELSKPVNEKDVNSTILDLENNGVILI